MATASPLDPLTTKLESLSALDGVGKAIGSKVRALIPAGPAKDALSGTWLGHALHPMMTDVVIGSFMSASLLDLLGGDDDGEAASRLIGVGLASYLPTAVTGFNDWADTEVSDERTRRVGLVHAWTNATAATLYGASLMARRRGDGGRGKVLAAAGGAVLGVGGFLGGHMTLARGVGANQTAFDEGPSDWTDAMGAADLPQGEPTSVVIEDTPVLVLRHGDHFHAIHDRCSHRGCPLSKMGEIEKETITCKCHGSQFSLRDGSVQRGPATVDQPSFEVRERDGRIELRLAQ